MSKGLTFAVYIYMYTYIYIYIYIIYIYIIFSIPVANLILLFQRFKLPSLCNPPGLHILGMATYVSSTAFLGRIEAATDPLLVDVDGMCQDLPTLVAHLGGWGW